MVKLITATSVLMVTATLCIATSTTAAQQATAAPTPSSSPATSTVSAGGEEAIPPMHVVFGSIPCYGHWNPLRSVAKATHARGHHVTLLMEEDKMKWCTSVQDSINEKRKKKKTMNRKNSNAAAVNVATFNCIPLPASGNFKRDFFINISKSDDVPSSFEALFGEMFLFTNNTQDAYSRALYVVRELTTGVAGVAAASPSAGDDDNNINIVVDKKKNRCTPDALARAKLIGISEAVARSFCEEDSAIPPISLMVTDSGTFPTFVAAQQFGIPSMALFPLSVNLPSTPATFMPMLGSGKPSRHHMSFGDRLGTYFKRHLMLIATKFIAVPQIFDKLREDANNRQQQHNIAAPAAEGASDDEKKQKQFAAAFTNTPIIPPTRGGATEAAMMTSIVFTPGIWGYDIAQPLCPNIVAIGSTAVGDDEEDDDDDDDQNNNSNGKQTSIDKNLVVDRRPREFGIDSVPSSSAAALPLENGKAIMTRRALLEDPLAIFLSESPACVNYGAVYVNFGTLSVLSDETFNRVLAALWHVPFCVVWKITEEERYAKVKAMLLNEAMPEALKQYTEGILATSSSASSSASSMPHPPDTGVHPRGRFYLGKHFASPEAILEHDNTRVFISHCGDTSVLESIHALVPVAGIPIFADQPDVCQRIEESGIGSYIGPKSTFSPERLVTKLIALGLPQKNRNTPYTDDEKHGKQADVVADDAAMASLPSLAKNKNNAAIVENNFYAFNHKFYAGNRHYYLSRMSSVRHMSTLLGGPAKAAAIIEDHYFAGLLNVKESMLREAGPIASTESASRIGLNGGGGAAAAEKVHPIYTHPHGCSLHAFPFLNKDVAREIAGGNVDGIAFLRPEDERAIPATSLTGIMFYDIFWLIFIFVGIGVLIVNAVLQKVLRALARLMGSCGDNDTANEALLKKANADKKKKSSSSPAPITDKIVYNDSGDDNDLGESTVAPAASTAKSNGKKPAKKESSPSASASVSSPHNPRIRAVALGNNE